jgi:S1-C subfamily serine protease
VKSGKVRRGQLGVSVTRVTTDLAASLGMPEAKGVIVNSVRSGSGAERAGIRQGDVITAINDAPVSDTNAFRNRVASNGPGSEVTLTVLRDNKEQKIRATLGEFTEEAAREENQNEGGPSSRGGGGKLGITVEPLTPDIAQELQLKPGTTGVVVTSVDPSGPAVEASIQRGDVIQEVNRQPVKSAEDLRAAIEKSGGKPVLLLINRRGETAFLAVRPRQ